MKLGVAYGSREECSGSSASSLTTVWLTSCRSRRKREIRIAVSLQRDSNNEYVIAEATMGIRLCAYGVVK